MITKILQLEHSWLVTIISVVLAFAGTIVSIKISSKTLPHDIGRNHAINGQMSKGKPRGVGIVFIICFIVVSMIFVPFDTEYLLYCVFLFASMMSGFLDDKAAVPWGELKKGIIDFLIAILAAVTFVFFNPEHIGIQFLNSFVPIPAVLYMFLATILIWVSINVTNCTDGVDGLSGSLSIVSFATFYFIFAEQGSMYSHSALIIISCVLGYLWYNISPSSVLMGDAGSRALGFLLAVFALKTYNPLIYILVALVFIVDGGLGLVKVSLIRITKKKLLMNIRTPIHDHVRKLMGWSDTQVVFRFSAIQIAASLLAIYLISTM